MKVILAGLFLLLLGSSTASGQQQEGWLPDKMPNPWTHPASCSRTVPSWVCDPDGVIPRGDQDLIEGVLKEIAFGKEPYVKLPCGSQGNVGPQVHVLMQIASLQATVWERREKMGLSACACNACYDLTVIISCPCIIALHGNTLRLQLLLSEG